MESNGIDAVPPNCFAPCVDCSDVVVAEVEINLFSTSDDETSKLELEGEAERAMVCGEAGSTTSVPQRYSRVETTSLPVCGSTLVAIASAGVRCNKERKINIVSSTSGRLLRGLLH